MYFLFFWWNIFTIYFHAFSLQHYCFITTFTMISMITSLYTLYFRKSVKMLSEKYCALYLQWKPMTILRMMITGWLNLAGSPIILRNFWITYSSYLAYFAILFHILSHTLHILLHILQWIYKWEIGRSQFAFSLWW